MSYRTRKSSDVDGGQGPGSQKAWGLPSGLNLDSTSADLRGSGFESYIGQTHYRAGHYFENLLGPRRYPVPL